MKLYKAFGNNESGDPQEELVMLSDNVAELKERGRRLCRDNGVENAVWIGSLESWQELSANEHIYYVIRP